MVAAGDFVDRCFTVGALRYTWINVVHHVACLARDLTFGFMVRIPALEARLETTGADCTSIATTARSRDCVLAVRPGTPL